MARRPEDKPKPAPSKMDDPEQSARFIEAASELGADGPEAAEAFERAFDRIALARPAGTPAPAGPVPARMRAREPKRRKSPS